MKKALEYPCPSCGAAVGEHCAVDAQIRENILSWHYGRIPATFVPKHMQAMSSRPFYRCGQNPSRNCQKGNHTACHGRHGRNHGVQGELCTCDCHLPEAA